MNSYNQISNSGYTYGSSGGNTADGGTYTYTYDAENRLTSVVTGSTTYCYAYDGNDLRVKKGSSSSGCSSPSWSELYWRNIAGTMIAETDGSGSTANSSYNEYVLFAGQRVAQSNPSTGNVYYYVADHLGSTRVVTNASGSPCYEADFFPYGLENTPSGFSNSCSTNYKFTGYERDPETGNDYAFARYYSQREERFLSPDPLDGDASDPQTLNKYTYVRNNPTNFTDPTGLCGNDDPGGCGGGGGGGGGLPPCSRGCWGDGPENREPPSYSPPDAGPGSNPTSGEGASGDPWAMGCEALGMPCGMGLPGGGRGIGSAGCDFIECGLFGNGLIDKSEEKGGIQSDNAVNFAIGGIFNVLVNGVADLLDGLLGNIGRNAARAAAQAGLDNQAAGKIIGWGTGQSNQAVAQTQQLADNLTQDAVKSMADRGLTLDKIQQLASQYSQALADPVKAAANNQLAPRLALMNKIIQLWPK